MSEIEATEFFAELTAIKTNKALPKARRVAAVVALEDLQNMRAKLPDESTDTIVMLVRLNTHGQPWIAPVQKTVFIDVSHPVEPEQMLPDVEEFVD